MICTCCQTQKPNEEFYPDEMRFPGFCRKCRIDSLEFIWLEFKEKWDTWTSEQKWNYFTPGTKSKF